MDTDVVIKGDKEKDNIALKELALLKAVRLFISPETMSEQQAHSLNHYFGDQVKADRIYSIIKNDETYKKAKEERQKQEILYGSEEREWGFWEECGFEFTKSTFAGLVTLARNGTKVFDVTGEINLFNILIQKHKIGKMDAAHLMHAHSAKINYFLTYDKALIKKGNKVKWLYPKIFSPRELLKQHY